MTYIVAIVVQFSYSHWDFKVTMRVFLFGFRYLSYGSGPKRFPLADVLQYAMEFASSKPVCTSPVEDIDSSAPPGGTTGQPPPLPRWVLLSNGISRRPRDDSRFDLSLTSFSLCRTSSSAAEQDSLPPLESSGPALAPAAAPLAGQQQRMPIHKPFTQSRLPPDLPMHPAPRHITEEELRVLESCLHRWRSEVENDTRGASPNGPLLSFSFSFIVGATQ